MGDLRALHHPARDGHDQAHGQVCGVFGQHARRVGDRDAAGGGGGDIDVVDAGAEIGDQLKPVARLGDHLRVDAVGDGGHQHVGPRHRRGQGVGRHRRVVGIELGVEQLAHPRLHRIGELSGDNDFRLADGPWATSSKARSDGGPSKGGMRPRGYPVRRRLDRRSDGPGRLPGARRRRRGLSGRRPAGDAVRILRAALREPEARRGVRPQRAWRRLRRPCLGLSRPRFAGSGGGRDHRLAADLRSGRRVGVGAQASMLDGRRTVMACGPAPSPCAETRATPRPPPPICGRDPWRRSLDGAGQRRLAQDQRRRGRGLGANRPRSGGRPAPNAVETGHRALGRALLTPVNVCSGNGAGPLRQGRTPVVRARRNVRPRQRPVADRRRC